jgi:hypothetical protein
MPKKVLIVFVVILCSAYVAQTCTAPVYGEEGAQCDQNQRRYCQMDLFCNNSNVCGYPLESETVWFLLILVKTRKISQTVPRLRRLWISLHWYFYWIHLFISMTASLLDCINNKCDLKRYAGDKCENHTQCYSNTCVNGVCLGTTPSVYLTKYF